jgi:acyl-CoA synthetase (NDP forming)
MTEGAPHIDPLFHPRSIAIVGASQNFNKWGAIILHNTIIGNFSGKIYPINPRVGDIFGIPAYPGLEEVPGEIDLAVIVIPKEKVIDALGAAARKGIRYAVLITAGYSETGTDGKRLEEETASCAKKHGIRLVGPNCMGIVSMIPERLASWMPSLIPEPGPVSIVSQSGNMGYSLVQALNNRGVGVCRLISSGNEADLKTPDFLRLLGNDPETRVILSYIEGVDDGRNLFDAFRVVSPKKPIVVLKSGHTAAGARASASHTGALAGSDDLYGALFSQTGVIRARDIEEMIDFAALFSAQPLPGGTRVGIITMGGGWGVLAADACDEAGLSVVPLSPDTRDALDAILPSWWSRSNPVDLVAGLREGDFSQSLVTLLSCDYIDALMLLGIGYGNVRGRFIKESPYAEYYNMKELGTQFMEADEVTARTIIELIDRFKKPMVPVVDQAVITKNARFIQMLKEKGIIIMPSPKRGARALSALTRYGAYLRKERREPTA